MCKNAYQRARRKVVPMTGQERKKDIARSYAGVYKRRGKLIPQSCEVCGSAEAQMHHDDYDRPLAVRWLCRTHHMALHKELVKS
jgi:hypothetical protein